MSVCEETITTFQFYSKKKHVTFTQSSLVKTTLKRKNLLRAQIYMLYNDYYIGSSKFDFFSPIFLKLGQFFQMDEKFWKSQNKIILLSKIDFVSSRSQMHLTEMTNSWKSRKAATAYGMGCNYNAWVLSKSVTCTFLGQVMHSNHRLNVCTKC